MEKCLKLFKVDIRFHDPHLSMLMTHGGTTGGAHKRSVFVPASSPKEAVSIHWEKMLKVAEQKTARNLELFAKKKAGTISQAEETLIGSPQNPVQLDRWHAEEVVVPGHEVLVIKIEGSAETT